MPCKGHDVHHEAVQRDNADWAYINQIRHRSSGSDEKPITRESYSYRGQYEMMAPWITTMSALRIQYRCRCRCFRGGFALFRPGNVVDETGEKESR
ncbi:hypothetical protein BofuT4_uP015690.1 [Botrytis cinerea T4]|uniref:Uncharacterized protein n=1 Tax=Botryotinia fuckeliana (strain T4) TaxID=999810 RepID=G2YHS6_BOTF4|nr:hypothetical protein BofuT4_uP015690.1 [Botrytis cinerea T4]